MSSPDPNKASGTLESGEEFARLVQNSVAEALGDILGQSGSMAVLYHLKIEKSQTSMEDLHGALVKLFGQPALVIEKMIIKRLFEQMGLVASDSGSFDFRRSLNSAKKAMARSRSP